MPTSSSNKRIALAAEAAFGGRMDVTRHEARDGKSFLDILSCANQPQEGVTSFSTVGLSDVPLRSGEDEFHARVELVGACASIYESFPLILASAGFMISQVMHFCAPGVVFEDVVKGYEPSSPMRHLLLTSPFLWEGSLPTLALPDKTVAWLLIVPISDEEKQFSMEHGPLALEALFEKEEIDIYDLLRPSVR